MASFPTSVKTFAARNTGDVIQAAHVGDLQDEVNAVEDGLRNGTAPLNSSNSTFAALSITGASTFGSRPVMPPPQAALVFAESTGTLGSSALSTISWLGEAYVANSSIHSTTTNPERLIPQSTGFYQFTAQLHILAGAATANVGNRSRLNILDSSGGVIASQSYVGAGDTVAVNLTGYKRFDALGGFATVQYRSTGGTNSLSSGIDQTWFAMVKL